MIDDESVFTDAAIWTPDHLDQLDEHFVRNPVESGGNFLERLSRQLEPTSTGARQLAAEMLWALYLFPDNIGGDRKLENLRTVWDWSGEAFPSDHPATRAIEPGVGSGGPGFLMHQWKEFAFLIAVTSDLKRRPPQERTAIFDDPRDFARWIDAFEGHGNRQLRHVLRFLFFPDHFECIASGRQKRKIARAFTPGLGRDELRRYEEDPTLVDDRLLEIRREQEKKHPGETLDFYGPPLIEVWQPPPDPPVPPKLEIDPDAFDRLCDAFLYHYPGFETFASDARLDIHERSYKEDLAARFHELFDDLEAPEAIDDATAKRIVGRVYELLTANLSPHNRPQNLISWRYFDFLRHLDAEGELRFARGFADLLGGTGSSAERIERFNAEFWPLVRRRGSASVAVTRSFPTLFLMLDDPEHDIFIRTELFSRIARALTGERLFDNRPLTAEDYRHTLALAHAVRDRLNERGWKPHNLIDVQSFLWVANAPTEGMPAGLLPWPGRRVVKIAPGANADRWDECRDDGCIVVGWDDIGDLRQYDDREAILEALADAQDEYRPALGVDASQLDTFRSLGHGDLVVANRGRSDIVAVGIVQEPGYRHDPDRPAFRNVVPVRWYPSVARTIAQQGGAWNRTVVELSADEYGALFEDPPGPEHRTFDRLLAALRRKGFHFLAETVANYLLALQTKRFVILTGISGTGKTRLAMHVAQFFGAAPVDDAAEDGGDAGTGEYRVVAVRPDWTDDRGLLGYYNPIAERYAATDVLRFLLRAREAYDAAESEDRPAPPFFLVLDEMNLARVEHYFSDFLSALESDEPLVLHGEEAVAAGDTGEPIPGRLHVPPNLFITGTVNVDETTFMFSPKVLDRAFTIELNDVDLRAFGADDPTLDAAEESPLTLRRLPAPLPPVAHRPGASDWNRFGQLAEGELRRVVVDLNDLLTDDDRAFGYRVAAEIARFVTLAVDQSDGDVGSAWAALDLAVLQKVLPKFHGTQQELERTLRDVFSYAVSAGYDAAGGSEDGGPDGSAAEVTNDGGAASSGGPPERAWKLSAGRLVSTAGTDDDPPPRGPQLPRTAAKVWRMLRRLSERGFTSFIE